MHQYASSLMLPPKKNVYLVYFCKEESHVYQQHVLQFYNIPTFLCARQIHPNNSSNSHNWLVFSLSKLGPIWILALISSHLIFLGLLYFAFIFWILVSISRWETSDIGEDLSKVNYTFLMCSSCSTHLIQYS